MTGTPSTSEDARDYIESAGEGARDQTDSVGIGQRKMGLVKLAVGGTPFCDLEIQTDALTVNQDGAGID